ncbi:5-(carboxyamino)imidazole ribonucleotide synthase [uncultured Alistipes sp.]|jgi:phosphoribosylaminoimidazole carboxylase, ATPase subunit|uniref:5-(carboxyamino)imidazole ribonucleotide synthase n=1 Tax=uncultured Alistipes sp. TaxID=538949 RepID=UPI0025CBFA3B|nr:5-(carboxyamino)imidazole ribonucleotide synthase [uncultured Alistipes sp.]
MGGEGFTSKTAKTIGIIGGGQLGLMITEQAHLLGVRTICLDPAADAPAFAVCDEHIVAAYDDPAALEELCRRSDVVTYEFENVPGDVLIPLEKRYDIPQGFRPLYDSQDRLREKDNARANGLLTPEYAAVDDQASLRAAVAKIGLPAVLKTRTLGYDGHGQLVLKAEADIERALPMLTVPCILEQFVPFDFEVSIVMVSDGNRIVSFPIGRNIHRDGILDLCLVPAADMDDDLRGRMTAESERFMHSCGYVGILAIEYFIRDGAFYFNEMAPRPHNSGHYTIEGSTTNQFRELVRFLVGEPLQQPELVAPTIMKNILGQDLEAAEKIAAENRPGVYVHLYGKSESRPKRKMGHITFVGTTPAEYDAHWAGRFK